MTQRLFLAVGLDDDTRRALAAHLDAAVDGELPGRRVPPENWHITLRFLGAVSSLQRDGLLAYLDEHLDVEPFSVRFGGLGAFPRPARATVSWLAVDAPELGPLAATCEHAAVAVHLAPEDRPFHAHLTLGRIRPAVDMRRHVADVVRFPRRLQVDAISLYESKLRGSRAAEHVEVARIEL